MKQRLMILFFLPILLLLLFVKCGDKEEKIPPFLTVEIKNVNFDASASSRDIPVKTNEENWSVNISADADSWIEALRRGNNLRIVVTENVQSASRRAEIKIVAGSLSEMVIVEQLGTEPAILLSSDIFTVSADGEDIALEVTSNVEYDISIPSEVNWIRLKPENRSADMVTKEFYFEVDWNSEESERRAELSVKQSNGAQEKKVIVIQKPRGGYTGEVGDDIVDDVKVPVNRATATSYQPGGEIEKSFDGDYGTSYHSNWSNGGSDYFPITLDYFFEDQESIDYLIYHPRNDGGSNGNFKEVEIWVATEDDAEPVKLIEHDFKGSGAAAKIAFEKPLVKPRMVRFVVKSGAGTGQGFASCSEMEFYRYNPDNFNPLELFTDLTCSELKPGIGLDQIKNVSNNFYRNIAFYLSKGEYPSEFRIQEYRAWPHPDAWAKVNKTSTLSLLDNPTGIYVEAEDELVVFVGQTSGYTLSLKIQDLDKPGGDGYGNASFYPLSEGVNKIKPRNKGLAYVFYHTSDYRSAPAVKIHFATGEVNGYFDSQKHDSSDWNRLLKAASYKYFDVLGKYAHLTFETDAFRNYTGANGLQLINAYDELVELEQDFLGLMKYDRPPVNRAYFHVMYTSYMYSTSYRTAYEVGTQGGLLSLDRFKSEPWGPAHELGHTFQTRPGLRWLGMTEVSNNLHSLYVQTEWGNSSRIETENISRFNNRYEKAYYNSFIQKTPHPGEGDVFCKLISLWQLQLYFANARGVTDLYKDLYERVRTSPDKSTPGEQQLEFVRMVCDITQTDLIDFFRRWGYLSPFDRVIDDYGESRFLLTQDQIDRLVEDVKMQGYSPMNEKIEYICDSNWEYFKKRQPVQPGGKAMKNGLSIQVNGWTNVVAYEVYDGEQLVFVTNKNSFTLDNEAVSLKIFAIAYDGARTEVNL